MQNTDIERTHSLKHIDLTDQVLSDVIIKLRVCDKYVRRRVFFIKIKPKKKAIF